MESVTLGASCDDMSSGMIMTVRVAGGPCPLVGEAAAQEPPVAPVVMGTGDRSSGVGATEIETKATIR